MCIRRVDDIWKSLLVMSILDSLSHTRELSEGDKKGHENL